MNAPESVVVPVMNSDMEFDPGFRIDMLSFCEQIIRDDAEAWNWINENTKVVILDEPTSGLDPLTALALDELLLDLKSKLDMTIVVVTHELASIQRLADRIFFIDNGALIFSGTPAEAQKAGLDTIDHFFEAGRFD